MSHDVLVTGSSGHLGHALMLTLPDLGFHPIGIDILPAPQTSIVGSISHQPTVQALFAAHPIKHVLHCATLHKPHVGSHSKQQFIDTNISGTLVLLEAAAGAATKVESFLFFSTTSAFGNALSPKPGQPAAWIDEGVVPLPKNIYGVTKVAAEDVCRLVHAQTGLPTLVLRTSRFFPEEDDVEERRASMADENLKVLEMAYRRVDIEDIVRAAVCGMRKAGEVGWGKYIISAPPPFRKDEATLKGLDENAEEVYNRVAPKAEAVFREKGWKYLPRLDRVYVSSKAVEELGWQPVYTFERVLDLLEKGEEWRSELTSKVGRKGYHKESVGVYTQR